MTLVALGNPYLVRSFPNVSAYLTTYSPTPTSETALAKALFGEIAITGHLPVTIPGVAKYGDGIQVPMASPAAKECTRMIEITWLGHATVQFRLESGEVILMDPWIDGNPMYPKGHQIDRLDAILISHGHFDHIHDAVPLAKKFKPKSSRDLETCVWLTSKGVENLQRHEQGRHSGGGPA